MVEPSVSIRLQVKSRYNNAKYYTPSHHTTAIKNDFMRRSEYKDEKNVSSCASMGNSIFAILKKCQILKYHISLNKRRGPY